MIYAQPEASFEATLAGAPTGLTGTLGVRLLDNGGGTTLARQTSGVAEFPAGSGFYAVTLTAPSEPGQYSVFWDNGSVGPTTTSAEDLVVSRTLAPPSVPGPGEFALVSLEQARNFLQGRGTDQEDEIIEILIRGVTRSFAAVTNREFGPTDAQERVFAHPGGRLFDLAPYDLRAVSKIETGVEGTHPAAVVLPNFALRPKPSPDGVYQWIKFAANPGECEIAVTGDWGFATVPDDITHWALTTIAIWIKREVQVFERTLNLDSTFLERPQALPNAVRAGLAPWCRVSLP